MASVKRFCNENNDRISELPGNVMDYIFNKMSLRDAARTSILSRKWRYLWASYPKLMFDEHFFKEINTVKRKRFIRYEFPKAINKVLLVHTVPILEFSLYIPNIPNDLSPEIDQWMLFLTRNGIKELNIKNSNPAPYFLPSCIFSCCSLMVLKVKNCILKPPYAFGGFRYLVKLMLKGVSFSANKSASLLNNFPVLELLRIISCTGIDHKSICAPMLNYLSMVECDKVDWQWFEINKKLITVQIVLGKEVNNVERKVNMMKFLENVPEVEMLWLDGFSLKYLATGNIVHSLNWLPLAPLLTYIRLHDFGVDDYKQISSALCLLKNCPDLIMVEVDFAASTNNVTELVAEYLESSNCMDVSLDWLLTVKIGSMKGFKAELLFINVLLARSTFLQRMIIEQHTSIDASNSLTISRELLRFPRGSSIAEIIFVDTFAAK